MCKKKLNRKVLSVVLCVAILLLGYFTLGEAVPVSAAESLIYVANDGNDSNAGTSQETAVATMEKALELVTAGGTIQIVDTATTEQLSTNEPLCITKNVTIQGGSLTLNRAGIVLGADVTFQNVALNFANAVHNAILANGYTLTLNGVSSTGTWPVHLFCGTMAGYSGSATTIPTAGDAGAIVLTGKNSLSGADNSVSGTADAIGNIFAGNLSIDDNRTATTWGGNAIITISNAKDSKLGKVYACGGAEPTESGKGSIVNADSSKYQVSGDVTIQLCDNQYREVYGATGAMDATAQEAKNATVIVKGGENLVSGQKLYDIASLKVETGTFQPAVLNENVDITISSGAELDLSNVIEDNGSFAVGDFTGGGILAMGQLDKLVIEGSVTGETEFQTTTGRPNNRESSGRVKYSNAYIVVNEANSQGVFTFAPYLTQEDTQLIRVETTDDKGASVVAWTTSAEPDDSDAPTTCPISFSITDKSYELTTTDNMLIVPVNCGLLEEEYLMDVPLDITIQKDDGEIVKAEGNYVYTALSYCYSVLEYGFDLIYAYFIDEGDDYAFYFQPIGDYFSPGTYTINISVVLADNTTVTETLTLKVTCDHSGDTQTCQGYLCTKCGDYFGEANPNAHTPVYTASDVTINVSCEANCGYTGSATLCAENKNCDGIAATARVEQDGALEEETITITYAVKNGEVLNSAPVVAGTYTANITLGDRSVSVEFTISHLDANKDGKCDGCSGYADGMGAQLAGYSLSLAGDVGVNFYMELDAAVLEDDTAYMQFTLPNKPTPVKVMVKDVKDAVKTISGKEYYVFTCQVAAREMTDTITAQMVCNAGERYGTIYQYSVKDYATALMNRDGVTEKEKALTKAMLNYGAYAQKYFNYKTENLANAGCEENELNISADAMNKLLDYIPVVEGTGTVLTYAGSTLILESDIKARHYFRLAEDATPPNGLTLYVAPKEQNMEGIYYYYESDGIAATDLGVKTDYTIDGITVKYCPLSYVTTVLRSKDTELTDAEPLQNLMKALYLYYQAVAAYQAN